MPENRSVLAVDYSYKKKNRQNAAYIHTENERQDSVLPFLRYVRTWRNIVKPVYIRSCHSFHAHKSPYPPSGRVGDVVAMLQVEFLGIPQSGHPEHRPVFSEHTALSNLQEDADNPSAPGSTTFRPLGIGGYRDVSA